MTKKVVYLVGTLQTGGIERSVTDWCLYFMKHGGVQPVVVCLIKRSGPFVEVLENAGVPVMECKLGGRGFVSRLKKLLIGLAPDAVHSQVSFSMPWQVMGMRVARVPKIIFTQQNEYQNWNPFFAKLRLRLYFALFFRFIDHYTCVSEKVRDSLSALTGLPRSKFKIIPNAVNTEAFTPDRGIREAQRKELAVPEGVFLIGMVARFSPQKGHQFLVEGIKILSARTKNFRLILVGQGELLEAVKEQVRREQLESQVIFYGRSLRVESLVQAFDCFILPSLWEGMPLALLEAMACGIPVIGTNVAGIREVIVDGENGLLIPSRDPAAIADALEKLMNNEALRMGLSEKGRLAVNKSYSVSSCVKQYQELYG